jgi:hypothetical protein
MVPELRTDTCEEIADYAVGLAFCQAQGGPDESVMELCMSVARDTEAVAAGCAAIGIYEFSFLETTGFGYDYTTASQVASLITGSIPLLISEDMAAANGLPADAVGTPWFAPFPQTLADGSDGCDAFVADGGLTVCPMLVAVDSASNGGGRAANCEDWAHTDGHNLGWGQEAVAQLAPTLADGQSFQDFCELAGGVPSDATLSICLAVTEDQLTGACNAFASPSTAIRVICLDIGFDDAT